MKIRSRSIALAFNVFLAAASSAGAQDHIYNLNGTLADANGGPSLASLGGTLGATGYSFGADQGLTLSGVLGSTYTIAVRFRFDAVSGYRRVIDFKNRTSDNGPYVLNGAANFYNIVTGPTAPYAPNQLGLTFFTRDALGNFSAYFGSQLQYTFLDSGNEGVVSNNIARFFQDDLAVGGESSAGFVNYIATWNTALNERQIAAFVPGAPVSTVPEPSAAILLGAGLLAVGLARRRITRTSNS